jgi:endonuclease G
MKRIFLLTVVLIAFWLLPTIAFSQPIKKILTIDNAIPYIKTISTERKIDRTFVKRVRNDNFRKKINRNYLEVVDHKYYKLGYSENHEIAGWVAYLLTKEMVLERNAERRNNFKADRKVSTGSAQSGDYKHSGYDRGHICPSADMSFSQEAQNLTFLMSNIAPQLHSFNAGKWHELEKKVREWAVENDSIIVISGALFDSIITIIGQKNRVSVPYRFYKVIIDISYPSYKAIGFVMENKNLREDIFHYSMSLEDLEALTGMIFFPDFPLSKSIINLKNSCSIWDWERND